MNTLRLLLVVSFCVASGARTAELKGNHAHHDVCEWHCTVEDFVTVAKTFSRLVSEGKARIIDMAVHTHTDSNSGVCGYNGVENPSDFEPTWAMNEREPYLFLAPPSENRMEIDLNCNGKVRETPVEPNKTSPLESEVARSLIEDLIREDGVLCFPQQRYGNYYKCCHFDKLLPSKMTCNVVQSTIAQWTRALSVLWTYTMFLVPVYLPAVICLFPSLPKVSQDGTPCINLEDPSPAAFRSLLVKALIPQNTDSLLDQARLFFLKVVLIPGLYTILGPLFPTNFSRTLHYTVSVMYIIWSIMDFAWPTSQQQSSECAHCGEPQHSDVSDAMKAHLKNQLYSIKTKCPTFEGFSFGHVFSLLPLPSGFNSSQTALWSLCRILFFAILFLPAMMLYVALCTAIIIPVLMLFSPVMTLLWYNVEKRGLKSCPGFLFGILSLSTVVCSAVNLMFLGMHLKNSMMMAIECADTVFPVLAFSVVNLFYLYSCFSSFSEKYQLLKVKLFEGIKQHHDNGGVMLLVCTKKKTNSNTTKFVRKSMPGAGNSHDSNLLADISETVVSHNLRPSDACCNLYLWLSYRDRHSHEGCGYFLGRFLAKGFLYSFR